MPRPTKHWIITDTHLYHDAIIETCSRPVNVDSIIIKEAKILCAPQAVLIHLGDVIFYQYPKLKEILSQIPCRKILVMGNHDRKSKGWYMSNGFDFACDSFVWDDVLFTHKPVTKLPEGISFNIHGHWHNFMNNGEEPPEFWSPLTHFKLALEDTDYKPVSLCKIKIMMQKRKGT